MYKNHFKKRFLLQITYLLKRHCEVVRDDSQVTFNDSRPINFMEPFRRKRGGYFA
ncbi:predicted protein [Enterococcus faecalis Merz96]|nr:predicted protein [Enterococcus faecalis Merz96]EEU72620.1 predicted protein [Enterococcus faecalis HIP11704]EEU73374.1 predicted protein [Enterococcus faecalis JH1]